MPLAMRLKRIWKGHGGHASLKRERVIVEGNGHGPLPNPNGLGHEAFVDGIKTTVMDPCTSPQKVNYEGKEELRTNGLWLKDGFKMKTHTLGTLV